MSRKYRQAGYQDSDRDRDGGRQASPRPRRELSFEEKIQRKSMRHAIDRETREVLRCFVCGHTEEDHGAIGYQSGCSKCQSPLHCCRNCAHFNTGARWQCSKPIEQPVGDKTKANQCDQYRARLVLDHTGRRSRQSSPTRGPSSSMSRDPREAFNNLFKR